MVDQTEAAEQQVIIDTGDEDNINTALFSVLGADPINIGLSGLCGCSGLIVMSEVAVYLPTTSKISPSTPAMLSSQRTFRVR